VTARGASASSAVPLPSLSTRIRFTSPAAASVVIALVAILAFIGAPWNGYAMDDLEILANPLLHSAGTLPATLGTPWWWTVGALYRPLTLFTLGVDQLLGGSAAWLPHAINVVLHAIVAALVTRLYARFLPLAAAFAAGLLFAVLPAHVEAVASVVGRAELLSALAMVTLMLVVTGDAPPGRRTRLLAVVLSAAALASKEGGVVAPALALAAAWSRPAQRRHALQWAGWALVGTAALLLARLAVLGTLGGDLSHPAFRIASGGSRLMIALSMLPRAAVELVLPQPPTIDYAPALETVRHPDMRLAAAGVLLVVLAVMALVRHVRRPSAATLGMCVAAAAMAPTSNIFFASGVVLAARTLYAPSIGTGLLIGSAIAWCMGTRARGVLPYAVGALIVLGLVVTWREVPVWRSTDAVLTAMGDRQPDNYRVPTYRAYAARDAGRTPEAVRYFRAAAERFPADWEMLTNGATVALRMHDTTTAAAWLQAAIDAYPGAARARVRLVMILRARGDSAGATRLLLEGLRADPDQRQWAHMLRDTT